MGLFVIIMYILKFIAIYKALLLHPSISVIFPTQLLAWMWLFLDWVSPLQSFSC